MQFIQTQMGNVHQLLLKDHSLRVQFTCTLLDDAYIYVVINC